MRDRDTSLSFDSEVLSTVTRMTPNEAMDMFGDLSEQDITDFVVELLRIHPTAMWKVRDWIVEQEKGGEEDVQA